jgi:membrane-associated phospholipid phosphatase
MWKRIPADVARLALRRLCAGYLALAGCALFFPHRPGFWAFLVGLHLLGVLVLLAVGPFRDLEIHTKRRFPRVSAVIGDWYALALMPLLYKELGILIQSVHGGRFFDGWVLEWELWFFGGQPSRGLAAAFPLPMVSEALHFFYLSYFPIIFVPPLYLYFRRRAADHQRVVFTLMLTFLAHYLIFVCFPVQGPRYLFPGPGGAPSQGLMFRIAHLVLEGGSSRGTAFPSSHVGVAVAQTAMSFLVWPRAGPVLTLATAGLAVGAVYAGFHYGSDAIAGLIFGLLLFAGAPELAGRLGGGREAAAGAGAGMGP